MKRLMGLYGFTDRFRGWERKRNAEPWSGAEEM